MLSLIQRTCTVSSDSYAALLGVTTKKPSAKLSGINHDGKSYKLTMDNRNFINNITPKI